MMKKLPLAIMLGWIACVPQRASATDIVTLSGKKYFEVRDIRVRGNMLTFSTESDIVRVPLTDLPPALRARYAAEVPKAAVPKATPQTLVPQQGSTPVTSAGAGSPHDLVVATGNKYLAQMAEDLQATKTTGPATYSAADAFSIDQLEEARRDALANGRPVAFFVVNDAVLIGPSKASDANAKGAFAHFVQTFARSVTPVFVFPEHDMAKFPPVLTTALAKPSLVSVPRVVFTNSEATEVLADLSLSNDRMTFAQRNEVIYPAVGMIKRWYVRIANSLP